MPHCSSSAGLSPLSPSSASPKPAARSSSARSAGVSGETCRTVPVGREAGDAREVLRRGDPHRAPAAELLQLRRGEAVEHVAVADQLVADDLAPAVDDRPADDRDAGALRLRRRGRRGGRAEVAVDPAPAAGRERDRERVDGPVRAVLVAPPDHAREAVGSRHGRLVVGVRQLDGGAADELFVAEQRGARPAFENVRTPSASVSHTQSVASSTSGR